MACLLALGSWRDPASGGGVELRSQGKMKRDIDRWLNVESAVVWSLYRFDMLKNEQS